MGDEGHQGADVGGQVDDPSVGGGFRQAHPQPRGQGHDIEGAGAGAEKAIVGPHARPAKEGDEAGAGGGKVLLPALLAEVPVESQKQGGGRQ